MLENIKNFIMRNGLWLILGAIAYFLLKPQLPEIRTLLFISLIEVLAIGLAGLANFIFTKVDFIKANSFITAGAIFVGVHFLVGFGVMGLYFAM